MNRSAKHFTLITVYLKMFAMFRSIFLPLSILVFFSLSAFAQDTSPSPTPRKANSRPEPTSQPQATEPFDKADVATMASKCVELNTEKGLIYLELYPEMAPETVRNFLNLVAIGAYDTTTFSRVVPGFVIQGGNLRTRQELTFDLSKRGMRTVPDEPNKILHERGVVSMARTDEPNSASSHFFILVDAAPTLDGKFAAFGRVMKGMDIVDAINKMPVTGDKPEKPTRLIKATVMTCASASTSN